jgi:hypothetical protein
MVRSAQLEDIMIMKQVGPALAVTLALAMGSGVHATPDESGQAGIAAWNTIAITASVGVAKRTQAVSTIEVTLVQAAVYDAVNAIGGGRYKPYASAPDAPAWASVDAAVATAAHDVLVWIFPQQVEDLDARLAESLAAIAEGPEKQAGINVGAAAASAIIALRTNDGRYDPTVVYTVKSGAGAWQLTPPAYAAPQTPWVGAMKPFTMTSPSQFRPAAPPALTSAEYAKAYNETMTRGGVFNSNRTNAETAQGFFWADNFTVQYNRYLRGLAVEQHLSAADTARLLAQINMVASDAFIACMDAKYTYGFWRPVTAAPMAGDDGNPDTAPDAQWLPLLITPNHPEYPSAHACGSGAVTDALIAFFGTDRIRSTVTSTIGGSGFTRTFNRFSDMYADVHESRILAGLHYRFSMNVGRVIGSKVSRQLVKNYFTPMK